MPDALPRISAAPAARPVFAVQFTRREITAVRGAVSKHAAEVGLQGERLHDFVLAVNEIVTNAVVHGGGQGELRLWTIGHTVGCDVVDNGPPSGEAARDAVRDDGSGDAHAGGDAYADGDAHAGRDGASGEAAPGDEPGDESFDERGGRGLMLARLLVDSLDMQSSPQGTAVRLISVR